ncbi:nucleolar protein 9 [Anoplophora glabripennis]|uniref:nucleolar protein 9 n=1 Tax=Anoplophora glabripennis TaxID=217634 RepID=UPI0008753B1F|nr:nucleolar protein 9 [Anoplophora glabripennis]
MSGDLTNRRPNRKRKKSFLKNARKYAKKGFYGRGSELDADTYQYFVRIMEAYRQGFENEEDQIMFINNVFEQTENKELDCSCNQVGCRVIEMLLPFANRNILKKFIDTFTSDLRKLCSDRFASHVLEALIIQSCKKSLEANNDLEVPNQYFKDSVIKITKFLLNNLEDYMWDTYANHVIRVCLLSLLGLSQENITKGVGIKVEEKQFIPEEFLEIVKEYGTRLILWPQFNELCNSELTSGFLQILLKCLTNVDLKLLKKYLKKLLNEVFTTNMEDYDKKVLPKAFLSKSVIMLLETSVEISTPKLYTQIYASCFAGRLVKLATTRSTNFSVQKLLQHCKEKVEFEAMFDELANDFQQIIETGHSGVILALAQTCKRLTAKQGSFVQNLMKSFDCFEPEDRQKCFVICMCRFNKFENVKEISSDNLQKDKLSLHGTLILESLLDFNKPIKIVNSILDMEQQDLKNLFCNSMGSHITDSFVKGLFVGEKSREKLVRKMMGTYQELATSKYGSRSFEAIWSIANLKTKLQIMDELSHKNASWSNSEHGKIIANKVNLLLYKRNKEDWKNSFNKSNKSAKILADILK